MQFVTNGPDIPDELLQAHEDGNVVFFCGAGISYPAGLPGFRGLVEKIYRHSGTSPTAIEQESLDREHFDGTLDLLERRLPGQRLVVRQALATALKPNLRRKGATETHSALLRLAMNREGVLRLVTTNFDHLFSKAAKRTGQTFSSYAAPMLPIPKNSRWNGLVYLHGVLPRKDDDAALNRLVVTSGDFGLAYLTERWAARFVSELFRNYVVCFVGYSLNDPVLRYMMDALAADRMLGERPLKAWAFGEYRKGQEQEKTIEWEAKGVAPILYEVPASGHDHSALHKTLNVWSETYRDGALGKERIVVSHALARPSASTQQDDFVGRMLWALSDKSGLPAKRFAEFNPVPSLDWLLEAFSDDRYQHSDLLRFGVPPLANPERNLRFSLVQRPAPYPLAPRMLLVSSGWKHSLWDDVMGNLARWLVRHLNAPDLIIWISQRGGQLHERWAWLIQQELDRLARLEREGRVAELDEIRSQAANAIPGALMKTLWRLLLAGRVKSRQDANLYGWKEHLTRDGLSVALRLELRDLLSPKVSIKKPFHWYEEGADAADPVRMRQLVNWELVLTADHVHVALRDIGDEQWTAILPQLVDDFQQLLRDALDLARELGGADDHSDQSHWQLPSISPHTQNQDFHDWTALIELLRDSWLAVRDTDTGRAARIAHSWFDIPYPTFKRLALFAASQDNCVAADQWVDWLLADDQWWLWSTDTQRETHRLIVQQGVTLGQPAQGRLEAAILSGPPRRMFRDDLEADHWDHLVKHETWLRLAKLKSSGVVLGAAAKAALDELSLEHPKWQLAENHRDEFSQWMGDTGDTDFELQEEVNVAPRKRAQLVQWLKEPAPDRGPFYQDTWRDTCRTRLYHSLLALCDLASENLWPQVRWREALQAWSEEGFVQRSWRSAAPLVQRMPDGVLLELAKEVAWWVQAASRSIDRHEPVMLDLARRLFALAIESSTSTSLNGRPKNDPVTEAINDPVGHITQALMNLWFARRPNDNERLPADIEPLFTQLCDTSFDRFRHGRVLLGANLIALFRVDRVWTERHLLGLFDWAVDPEEAKAVWKGFLWSPRLYRPLLVAFKSCFLSTALHYADLGEQAQPFASFLTYAALEPIDGYSTEDFQIALGSLPQHGLQQSAQALSQALEGAGEKREEYWRNRIAPFWHNVWPKSLHLATTDIAEPLLRMVLAAGHEFPAALATIQDWLSAVEHPYYIVHRLNESGLCAQFPREALRLLDCVIDEQPYAPPELSSCLDQIVRREPALAQDAQYRRLHEYCLRRST
ncbi:anti-phage defense-associated sirtuin Dsr1 [Paraburkholderia sp. J63]|uniref:anti-phage defense-associated sirtuin Dsr1 n=1 Tax=Paraburkholderia sp. J63 TaxID=2805434 RepID=UPI002ABDDEA0|nr:anti-phage defense-associated sirtuin Dsr1 [Paraburkholderia sp. J63]